MGVVEVVVDGGAVRRRVGWRSGRRRWCRRRRRERRRPGRAAARSEERKDRFPRIALVRSSPPPLPGCGPHPTRRTRRLDRGSIALRSPSCLPKGQQPSPRRDTSRRRCTDPFTKHVPVDAPDVHRTHTRRSLSAPEPLSRKAIHRPSVGGAGSAVRWPAAGTRPPPRRTAVAVGRRRPESTRIRRHVPQIPPPGA